MTFTDWNTAPDETKVCYCCDKTLADIKEAIAGGAKTLDDIQTMTGACLGSRCEVTNPSGGCCSTDIDKILAIYGKGETGGGKCACCKK